MEDICEDYGQAAWYLGTIPEYPFSFTLHDHHTFITGKPMLVCGNSAAMVSETRFGSHFKVVGDMSVHYGPFDCVHHARHPQEIHAPAVPVAEFSFETWAAGGQSGQAGFLPCPALFARLIISKIASMRTLSCSVSDSE